MTDLRDAYLAGLRDWEHAVAGEPAEHSADAYIRRLLATASIEAPAGSPVGWGDGVDNAADPGDPGWGQPLERG